MMKINWDEFKAFKKDYGNPLQRDNFGLLIEFLRSFYSVTDIYELYDSLEADELSKMMMQKRHITSVTILEKYILKKF